jgi:hypothetical protein
MTARLSSRWLLASVLVSGCAASLPLDTRLLEADMGRMAHPHHHEAESAAPLAAELRIDGSPDGLLAPGRPATLGLSFTDAATGAPIDRFDIQHEKPLHLVAVSQDQSSFAHLHPTLDAGGRFTTRVNAPGGPDDTHADRAFAVAGRYFLFAEVAPTGRGASLARLDLTVPGPAATTPLVPDATGPDGAIATYLKPDGSAGVEGDAYRTRVRFSRTEHGPGMPMLGLTVEVAERTASGAYVGVRDLAPWLGMAGHAFVVGAAGDRARDRVFLHLHADGSGPTLSFMAMGADVPPTGLYRLWVQVKHRDRVLTTSVTSRL